MGLGDFLDKAISPRNIATPILDPAQASAVGNLQKILSSSSENSVRALSNIAQNGGNFGSDRELVQQFKESFVPSLMQGAAVNNQLGSSGVAGSISQGGARLQDLLEARRQDRMYNANQSLIDMYRSFSDIHANKYERGDSPLSSMLSTLTNVAEAKGGGRGSRELGYADWAGIGGAVGNLFGPVGSAVGSVGGIVLKALLNALFK